MQEFPQSQSPTGTAPGLCDERRGSVNARRLSPARDSKVAFGVAVGVASCLALGCRVRILDETPPRAGVTTASRPEAPWAFEAEPFPYRPPPYLPVELSAALDSGLPLDVNIDEQRVSVPARAEPGREEQDREDRLRASGEQRAEPERKDDAEEAPRRRAPIANSPDAGVVAPRPKRKVRDSVTAAPTTASSSNANSGVDEKMPKPIATSAKPSGSASAPRAPQTRTSSDTQEPSK